MTIEDKLLASRYHILKNIGSGAFGVTFLAEDQNIPTQPKCVVKQLKPLVNDPNHFEQAKKLFEKEAATLSKVGTHNQIPYLKDYFEEEGNFYLVQDFIDGIPLDQELLPNQPWSESAVLALLKDCLPILDFIHTQKPPIIHRDIKPANLIRRQEDGKIVLVDFGAVKESFQTKLVQSTVAIGTRGYMPTEQIRGKPRPASDIFALGMVAIQALTGVNPIDLPEDDNGELVWQYIEDEEGQLQRSVTVNASLAEVLSKIIRHDFKDRYQTAQEVTAALDNRSSNQEQNETSVILTEELNGMRSQEFTDYNQQKSQSEQETLKQNSAIPQPEQETLKQDSNSQNHLSVSQQSSSSKEENKLPSPSRSQNQVATSLKSPLAKNVGIVSLIIILSTVFMYGLEFYKQRQQNQAIVKQNQQNEERLNNLEETLTSLFDKKKYQECIEQSNSQLEDETDAMKEAKVNFYDKCSLRLAQSDVEIDKYSEAIQRAEKIQEESEVYQEAQTKIKDWSNELLDKGISEYKENGKLDSFKKAVDTLSTSNPVREQALQKKEELEDLHEKNEKLLSEANSALEKEQWNVARNQAQELKKSGKGYNYWETEASSIITKANEGMTTAGSIETNTETTNTGTTTGTTNTGTTTGTTNTRTTTGTTKIKPDDITIDLCDDEFNRSTGMSTAGCE
ncbi:MAG: hypothetical protein GVY04_02515 [Cyanobacteria bacterium]|jgi:serine/threonine-protein kinase|nr:hypothetical protein [Cyanobacteria bacterium GSL.Bin1]